MKFPFPKVQGVTHQYFKINDTTLHVAFAGKGKSLLLIHGWPQHWYVWRKLIPLLSDKYKLIMPDLPGFGWSTPAKNDDYRKEKLADYMVSLLDVLNEKQVILVGHDWGGWIGFLACLKNPKRFSNFLALGTTYPFKKSGSGFLNYRRFLYQIFIAMPFFGEKLLTNATNILKQAIKKCIYNKSAFSEEDFRIYLSAIQNPEVAKASSLMYRTFLTRELISLKKYKDEKLKVPTQLLIGENDPIIHPSLFKNFQENNRIKIEFIKNCGHFIPEEQPELVANHIKALNSK